MRWNHPPSEITHLLKRIPSCTSFELTNDPGSEIIKTLVQDSTLTWLALCSAQSQILQIPVDCLGFRKNRAYACGREREYIFFEGLDLLFQRKIEQDARASIHPFIKAARIYLDIIFVHPFEDGNARAARLWFTYHTATARLSNPDFSAIRRLPKEPGNIDFYWTFVRWAALNTISSTKQIQQIALGRRSYSTKDMCAMTMSSTQR